MERRALLAVVISLVILVVYQEVIIKRLYKPAPAGLDEIARPAATPLARRTEPEQAPPLEVKPERAVAPSNLAIKGRDVVAETDLYRAVFDTAGARLKSFRLKRFRTTVDPSSPPLELISPGPTDQLPLGLALRGRGPSDGTTVHAVSDATVLYGADRERLDLAGNATGTITFTGELAGAKVTKRLRLAADSYLIEVEIEAEHVPPAYSELAVEWNRALGKSGNPQGHEVLFQALDALQGDKNHRHEFSKLTEGKMLDHDLQWAGYTGRHFLLALVPGKPQKNDLRLWLKRWDEGFLQAQVLLPPGEFHARLFMYGGPKEIGILEQAGHSLKRAVDLGWFTFVALPLLRALAFSHRLTGNYGIDIILLTIIIKILFYPLTQKSFQSMREMQKLQPQMARIREQYKDDSQKMNKEIMELYRRHKVNPLGGCLPMLLQTPILFGLYRALLNAVELRHAPFAGWINDLSAPDRLGTFHIPFVDPPGIPVLTLLMGAGMLAQQWMTPTTGDKTQQKMMMFMPVVFTFMFLKFPAGLTLYWLVNNVLTVAQQYAMKRRGDL